MTLRVIKFSVWLLVGSVSYAQTLYIESSLSSAYFKDYKNDVGVTTLDNSYSKPIEFGVGGGVLIDVTKNTRFKWDFGVNYNKYKINTSFILGNSTTPSHYNLSYVSFKTGPYFSIINHPKIKLQAHSHGSFDYLIFGSNEYNDVYIDLTSGHKLSKVLLNYHYGLALEIIINSKNSFYISYDSKQSLTTNIDNDESYRLKVTSLMIGLRFKFSENFKENDTNTNRNHID